LGWTSFDAFKLNSYQFTGSVARVSLIQFDFLLISLSSGTLGGDP